MYRMLVGNSKGKEPLRRYRRGKEDNSKIGIKAGGWDGEEWIDLVLETERWQTLVNAGKEPSGFIKFGKILDDLRHY